MAARDPEPDPSTMTRLELHEFLRGRTMTSVPFGGACFGSGRAGSYAAARDGSLKTVRLGSRLYCPTVWLERALGLIDED
jgi:hypothetical protein